MAEREMLEHILTELSQMRSRMDTHQQENNRRLDEFNAEQNRRFERLESRIGEMREGLAGEKAKMATIISVVAVAFAGVSSWVFSHFP